MQKNPTLGLSLTIFSLSRLLISMRKSNFHLDFPSYFSEWATTCFWCFIKEESKTIAFSKLFILFACAFHMFTFFHYRSSVRAFILTKISSNFEHFMLTKGCWKISLWAYKYSRSRIFPQSRIGLSFGRFKKKTPWRLTWNYLSYHSEKI